MDGQMKDSRPDRKQIRLPQYDYSSPGAYFVTICTENRRCLLSTISVGAGVLDGPECRLTEIGKIVDETIRGIDAAYSYLTVDNYVIMPNHIHMLITISERGPSRTPAPTNASLPMLISTLKRFTNRKAGSPLWQRGYYEHVIRGEADYRECWTYIDNNPANWLEDRYFGET